jgi:hypothetical protein
MTTEIDLRAIADRMEIHEVLMRYCRGVDRGDPELLRSVYHEGAVDRHGPFQFTDAQTEFANLTVPRLDAMQGVAQHHITNYLIELGGDAADVESYFISLQPTKLNDGSEVLSFVGGRYLDRFERRGGRWAITERSVIIDWSRSEVPGEEWPAAKDFPAPGRRERDPSHALFARGVLA